MSDSLHCSLETITTLSIGYTPTQNVFGIKKIKNKIFVLKKRKMWQFRAQTLMWQWPNPWLSPCSSNTNGSMLQTPEA